MNTLTKRDATVDVAKGIGIYLVVLGHCHPDNSILSVITSFHMPLFFFLSGLFLFNKPISARDFLKKKAKTLLFPCLAFGIILSTYSTVLDMLRPHPVIPYGLRYVGIFINMRHGLFPGSLWFLPCLFLVETMLYGMHRRIHSDFLRFIVIAILGSVGCAYNHLCIEGLPWSFDLALICMPFTELGFLAKKYNKLGYTNKRGGQIFYSSSYLSVAK